MRLNLPWYPLSRSRELGKEFPCVGEPCSCAWKGAGKGCSNRSAISPFLSSCGCCSEITILMCSHILSKLLSSSLLTSGSKNSCAVCIYDGVNTGLGRMPVVSALLVRDGKHGSVGWRRGDGEDAVLEGEVAGSQAKSPVMLEREFLPLRIFEDPNPSVCWPL